MFRVRVPVEIRDSLPIPNAGYNHSWLYSSIPAPGKTNLVFYVIRIEGHRSAYCWRDAHHVVSVDDYLLQ